VKTDELIRLLSEDAPVRLRLGRMLALALCAGVLVSGAVFLASVGLRHNLVSAVETARVAFKIGATLALAIAGFGLLTRIGRPGAAIGAWIMALAGVLGAVALAVAAELLTVPQAEWGANLSGQHAAFCVFFIPVLSLAPLAAFLAALREGAPENPGRAGAAAGLAASAIGAALYAWHCPDDSPLFLATWYTLAITIVTTAGYLAGRRLLRW
jgi:hypothetical protein